MQFSLSLPDNFLIFPPHMNISSFRFSTAIPAHFRKRPLRLFRSLPPVTMGGYWLCTVVRPPAPYYVDCVVRKRPLCSKSGEWTKCVNPGRDEIVTENAYLKDLRIFCRWDSFIADFCKKKSLPKSYLGFALPLSSILWRGLGLLPTVAHTQTTL